MVEPKKKRHAQKKKKTLHDTVVYRARQVRKTTRPKQKGYEVTIIYEQT